MNNVSMLDTLYAHARKQGWSLDSLASFRMEEGEGEGDESEGGSEGSEGSESEGSEGSEEGSESEGTKGARSLADILGALDDSERETVLGEVSKARREAKGLRDRLKGAENKATEYDKLVSASQSEHEKAISAARDEGRLQAVAESGQIIARARLEAALTGLVPDPAEIVDDLNLAKYVADDGSVDAEAVESFKAKYAALAPQKGAGGVKPNRAQGSSGSQEDPQKGQIVSADQLKGLSPDAINKLRKEGRLNRLMGRK